MQLDYSDYRKIIVTIETKTNFVSDESNEFLG